LHSSLHTPKPLHTPKRKPRDRPVSGEKEGDKLRRNSDVVEIIKNTQFRSLFKSSGHRIPERILSHE
jgi:hypothetical protein